MEPYWEQIKEIVRESDIVLEILDARSIELSRNEQLEKIIKEHKKPRIVVVNKIDLISRDELQKNVALLKLDVSDEVVYVTNRDKKTIKNLLGRIRKVFEKYGKRKEFFKSPILAKPYREAKADVVIGVVGYPNVGKSSIINALAFKKKAKVSSKAGTTHGIHWISAGKSIKLIDTPGVIPLEYVDESKLAFIASRNPEKLKDPEVSAARVIEKFIAEGKLDYFQRFYNVELKERENPYAIMEEIAEKKNILKKGGVGDSVRFAINLLRDWQRGNLRIA
jgi:ribosome biogenesis GTPase A